MKNPLKSTGVLKKLKKLIIIGILFTLGCMLSLFLSNAITQKVASSRLYNDINIIPENKVGLLLGTTKYLKSGYVNLYYKYRLTATVELFKNNKIQYIVVSGDNSRKDYNEPQAFKDDLIELGIPEDRIFLDYAGFRTLDSIVRLKEIFGQSKVTIISQKFHNERAIYISRNKEIEAIGFNAKDVPFRYGAKVKVREMLARTKMMLDLYITHKGPKFLGESINIP